MGRRINIALKILNVERGKKSTAGHRDAVSAILTPACEGKRIMAVGYNGGRDGFRPGPNVANPSRRVASSVDRDDVDQSSHQKQFYDDKQKSHPHLRGLSTLQP